MKRVLLLGIFLGAQVAAQALETAYTALRVVGKRDGQAVLNRVVEVRGRNGAPQPAVWKIVLDDPRARGGIREVEVQAGRIIAERTPAARAVGNVMNFNQLNLDSEGAYTVANLEAQKAGVIFDHVDYLLKSGTGGGAPVWTLELFDSRAGRAGRFEIAADSGTILQQELERTTRGQAPDVGGSDRDYVGRDRDYVEPPPVERGNRVSRPGEPFRNVPDFFKRLGRRFERRGYQLDNFFTGREHSREEREY